MVSTSHLWWSLSLSIAMLILELFIIGFTTLFLCIFCLRVISNSILRHLPPARKQWVKTNCLIDRHNSTVLKFEGTRVPCFQTQIAIVQAGPLDIALWTLEQKFFPLGIALLIIFAVPGWTIFKSIAMGRNWGTPQTWDLESTGPVLSDVKCDVIQCYHAQSEFDMWKRPWKIIKIIPETDIVMSSTQYRMMANDPPSRHFLHLQTRPQVIPKNPPNILQKKQKEKNMECMSLREKILQQSCCIPHYPRDILHYLQFWRVIAPCSWLTIPKNPPSRAKIPPNPKLHIPLLDQCWIIFPSLSPRIII